MEPGGVQRLHAHEPEQMYYILGGQGLMTVNGEYQQVGPGDTIFFGAFAEHKLENTGETTLKYISAASPSFTQEECETLWPLPSLNDAK